MIESGPAAGALMAAAYGELTGHRDLIAFDMGGTTAKLALIEKGRPATTTAFELHRVNNAPGSGLPMNIQAIDLVEIGAGGGSIAHARLGVIAVGPGERLVDAGARLLRARRRRADGHRRRPRPRLHQPRLLRRAARCGWRRARRRARSRRRVARPLGLSLEDAAWGIHAIVNTNMELATRVVSIERGRDPARSHAGRLRRLGPRPRLPARAGPRHSARDPARPSAGVTAAIGLLAAEVRFDVARTYVRRLDARRSRHARRRCTRRWRRRRSRSSGSRRSRAK